MDTIIVGVDGSRSSAAAMEWAAQAAGICHARVVAVHVVPTMWEWEMSAIQVDTKPLIHDRRHDLNGPWTEPLRRAGVAYTTQLREGDPGKQLLDIASAEGADLLVIGGTPHGRVHDLVFGGVRHDLVTKAPCPVVLVPAPTRRKNSAADRATGFPATVTK